MPPRDELHRRDGPQDPITQSLERIGSRSSFAARRRMPTGALNLSVRDVGSIPLPVGLLESARVIGQQDLSTLIVRGLSDDRLPPLALCALLQRAHGRRRAKGERAVDLDALHAHCRERIESCLRTPARAADDWSIQPPRACRCAMCRKLGRFLLDARATRLEWPLAQAGRRHVHGVLDDHELPVRHTTTRRGRPYTLVLEKTRQLFTREDAERRALRKAQAWLKRHGGRLGAPRGR